MNISDLKPIFVLNGPNLNLLGGREPEIYGTSTLAGVKSLCLETARTLDVDLVFEQTNHEGALVELIHRAGAEGSAIVINPAAYTHTSIALLDAIKGVDAPTIEVHLSRPVARETFRAISYVSLAAAGATSGLGAYGYALGIQAAVHLAKARAKFKT